MSLPEQEPVISVGLMENAKRISFDIVGNYILDNIRLAPGHYSALAEADTITLLDNHGLRVVQSTKLHFIPELIETGFFVFGNIRIGTGFHWDRIRKQKFQGKFVFQIFSPETFTVINRISVERYLGSVICSEMSSENPEEFLKAHCIISRSWILAQVQNKKSDKTYQATGCSKWTDAGAHTFFDVCADDHCQRYHGTGHINAQVKRAVNETAGEVLVYEDKICDARFSKCCGGITEKFSTAWADLDVEYLSPVVDSPGCKHNPPPTAISEDDARRFICSSPASYCNVSHRELLSRILPDFDCETQSFFRWHVLFSGPELSEILLKKTGIVFGKITSILPVARGASGRIYKLKIVGEKAEKIFSKELEIRRILSESHLYSSAFVVDRFEDGFKLSGAGWGHGVGLCQIGAASMAECGHNYKEILSHYFKDAELKKLY